MMRILTRLLLAAIFVTAAGGFLMAQEKKQPAPEFEVEGIDGKIIKLSDYRGKVVILDFWATWCPPCKAEIPGFIEMANEYKDLIIIGAALDNVKAVKKFAKDYKINYPLLIAGRDLVSAYGGITGVPTTFIIDVDGNVSGMHVGYAPKEAFVAAYKKALNKEKKAQ
jgi:thiol-disulfide isomerase/thioredoxin